MNNSLKNIHNNKNLLNLLATCKKCTRDAIIKTADKKLIAAVCDIIHNFLIGNVNINKSDFEKLAKYKKTLRKLVKKSNTKSKKNILIQHGGFLQYLIPSVIGGLSTIVSSLISKSE